MATKTTSLTMRVSPAFKTMLDKAARRDKRSRTNFLEKLVEDHCRSIEADVLANDDAAPQQSTTRPARKASK